MTTGFSVRVCNVGAVESSVVELLAHFSDVLFSLVAEAAGGPAVVCAEEVEFVVDGLAWCPSSSSSRSIDSSHDTKSCSRFE